MKKTNLLASLILLGAAVPCLTSCSEELDIVFNTYIDPAYVGDVYDIKDAIKVQKGVNYSLECYYFNEELGAEFQINTNGTKFTPTVKYDVSAVITASRKNESITKTKLIKVKQHADPVDELLAADGICSWGDPEIYKELNDDPVYIYGDNSRTSLLCNFTGANKYVYGCGVFSLQNFRFFDYYTDTEWEDAFLRFYVFNLSESKIEWQLRVVDNYIAPHFVDIDWGQQMSISQIAEPGVWTEVKFPLRKMGITHALIENEEQTRKDQFNVKCRLVDAPDGEYSYRFAVDGIDVVPASYYPDIDTANRNTRETPDMGWENIIHDNGWEKSSSYFDNEFVYSKDKESLSSLVLEFDKRNGSDIVADGNYGFNVIFDCETAKGATQITSLPDLRSGSIKVDFHFSDNITNKKVKLLGVRDWESNAKCSDELTLTPIQDNWYRLEVDLSTISQFSEIDQAIRLGFIFPGVTDSNKATAKIHLDNFEYSKI